MGTSLLFLSFLVTRCTSFAISFSYNTSLFCRSELHIACRYEEDIKTIVAALPSVCQGFLMSATLNPDVDGLKQLILHTPVLLSQISLAIFWRYFSRHLRQWTVRKSVVRRVESIDLAVGCVEAGRTRAHCERAADSICRQVAHCIFSQNFLSVFSRSASADARRSTSF